MKVIWVVPGASFVTCHHPLRTQEDLGASYHIQMIGTYVCSVYNIVNLWQCNSYYHDTFTFKSMCVL